MRKRLPIQVVLAIMTTTTIVVWVGFSVYQAIKQKADPQVPANILEPITSELDLEALDEISEKLYFDKGETVAFSSQSAIIILEQELETETDSEDETEESGESTEESTDESTEENNNSEATQSAEIIQ
jgi:hypothetical protein